MKKALFLLALLAIMFMANVNVKAQCPDGWSQGAGTIEDMGCTWDFIFCYHYDINAGYCLSIPEFKPRFPCDREDQPSSVSGGYQFLVRSKAIRDKMILNALEQLIPEEWLESEDDWQCSDDGREPFYFRFFNDPACYWQKWVYDPGQTHYKQLRCDDRTPRDCPYAFADACWEWITDPETGQPVKSYNINRQWYTAIPSGPNPEIWKMFPDYVPKPSDYYLWDCDPWKKPRCYDNCY